MGVGDLAQSTLTIAILLEAEVRKLCDKESSKQLLYSSYPILVSTENKLEVEMDILRKMVHSSIDIIKI